MQLHKHPDDWVMIEQEPEIYITKATEAGKDSLFAYLSTSQWHLADQIADGFFWINEQEEILLLRQKLIMKDYWQWTASRSFFAEAKETKMSETITTETEENIAQMDIS